MIIGIFDPNLNLTGHYLRFNKHIARLFGFDDNQIIFFDISNILEKNYRDDIVCKKMKVSFINVADTQLPKPKEVEKYRIFSKKWFDLQVKKYFWYKKIFDKIKNYKIDFLMITSQGDFPFYFLKPRFKFIIILTTNRILKATKRFSLDYLKQFVRKKIVIYFLKQAQAIFVLDEYLKNDILNLNLKNLDWMPDRCFETINGKQEGSNEDKNFNVLTPGAIYQGKKIDFILEAYEKYNLKFKYIVAGLPKDRYGEGIVKKIQSLEEKLAIKGIFRYMSNDEYKKIINNATFVLLPYSSERHDQMSGVMFDALENDTPIIAPHIQPFTHYINKYRLGLLYKPDDLLSFVEILRKASKIDRSFYKDNFFLFKKDFSYTKAQERIKKIIQKVIN